MYTPTARSIAVTLRTYNRPKDDAGTLFETWEETVRRSHYDHHLRLWEEAGGKVNTSELSELLEYALPRKALVAGRTMWLGGTEYAFSRPCCQFNCAFVNVSTVYDLVDASWLLFNGCGVGFTPKSGTLHGFLRPVPVLNVIPSQRDKDFRGPKENEEILPCDSNNWEWTIRVGDSAEAWSKAIGKLFNQRAGRVESLTLDFSNVRGAGGRLRGYGWICNGYTPFARALIGMYGILNQKAGELLEEVDIMDVLNMVGEVLSSRRAAEACEPDWSSPNRHDFLWAKKEYYRDNPHRRQSNNSFKFWMKPSKAEIRDVLYAADECGGCPGLVNAGGAIRKCPWFQGFNPCFEILLSDKGFCNLVSLALPLFRRNMSDMERAAYLIARANYRQTCVNLHDGILQPAWNQTNEALRLCGVSPTGVGQCGWMSDYQIRRLRNAAILGAYSMADELGMPRPKAVTTGKPEGTRTKISGTEELGELGEGIHDPLGRYIFNWINFSVHDPMVRALETAGYQTIQSPVDPSNVVVCFPLDYRGFNFTKVGGMEVNLTPAVTQLERYLRWNNVWADHNISSTVSYSPEELPEIVDWVDRHWDDGFIAVAFLKRNDPTKSASDLGHPYLPQEVVKKERYEEYIKRLRPLDLSGVHGIYEIDVEDCKGGVCPVK